MRSLWLVLFVILAAGCFGTPSPGASTTVATSPTPSGAAASFVPVHIEHDFSKGEPEKRTFEIPPASGSLSFRLFLSSESGTCGGDGWVNVTAPDGSSYARTQMPTASVQGPGSDCAGGATRKGVTMPAGTYIVTFVGQGIGKGVIDVQRA